MTILGKREREKEREREREFRKPLSLFGVECSFVSPVLQSLEAIKRRFRDRISKERGSAYLGGEQEGIRSGTVSICSKEDETRSDVVGEQSFRLHFSTFARPLPSNRGKRKSRALRARPLLPSFVSLSRSPGRTQPSCRSLALAPGGLAGVVRSEDSCL